MGNLCSGLMSASNGNMFSFLLDVQQDEKHPDERNLIFQLEGEQWMVSLQIPTVRTFLWFLMSEMSVGLSPGAAVDHLPAGVARPQDQDPPAAGLLGSVYSAVCARDSQKPPLGTSA